jgi:hypothetical protein
MSNQKLNTNSPINKSISRRKFLENSAAIAALSVVPVTSFGNGAGLLLPKARKETGSKFGGIQIGAITYSWRSMACILSSINICSS